LTAQPTDLITDQILLLPQVYHSSIINNYSHTTCQLKLTRVTVAKSNITTRYVPKPETNNKLTSWSRDLLEKLTVNRLVKKFLTFYKT
jgi:hypothetical protein